MTLVERCNDCDWSEEWEGGKASNDPAIAHLTWHPDHTVSTEVQD